MQVDNRQYFSWPYGKEKEEKGGFFDLPGRAYPCYSPYHNFPSHLYIPPGKGYRHVCPDCGAVTEVHNNAVF